tara:strand:+ start:110 stop:535 length:426 start_codon:yes stop_codon:yes gene_type:complete
MDSNNNSIINKNDEVSLIDQIPNYNEKIINRKINLLKDTLNNQLKINQLLKDESNIIEKDIKDLEFFVSNYNLQVENQVNEIESIVGELKKVISENRQLEKSNEKLIHILEDPEMIKVATQLKKIKNLNDEIDFFLEKNGI